MGILKKIFCSEYGEAAGRRLAAEEAAKRKVKDRAKGIYKPDSEYYTLPEEDLKRKGNMDEYYEGTAPQMMNAIYGAHAGVKSIKNEVTGLGGNVKDIFWGVKDLKAEVHNLQNQIHDLMAVKEQLETLQNELNTQKEDIIKAIKEQQTDKAR